MKVVNGYEYPDVCVISRASGETDDSGVEILTPLYDGVCEIQYGGNGNTALLGENYQSQPTLFIPVSNVKFQINDIVVVTSLNDRVSEYSIEQFESLGDFDDTCIWLKSGVE